MGKTPFSTAIFLAFIFSGLTLFSSCEGEENGVPKPHAFPKIEWPKNEGAVAFDRNFCRFTFQHPKYVSFEQDSAFFDEKTADPCWFNLVYPKNIGAKIHCSYYPIRSKKDFEKHLGDAFTLAGKHNIKADYIDELPISNPSKKVAGMVFDIQGAAASPFQFYLTDSTQHFFRGALYFNTQSKPDSLAPVFEFVKRDIIQMLNSFEWTHN